MQQLANHDPYYNILAPQVAGNLSTDEYESLFQAYKFIYPDDASRHFVDDLNDHGDRYHDTTMIHLPSAHRLLLYTSWWTLTRAPKFWIISDIRSLTSSIGTTLPARLINTSKPSLIGLPHLCRLSHSLTHRIQA
jgi:hypothetical protein